MGCKHCAMYLHCGSGKMVFPCIPYADSFVVVRLENGYCDVRPGRASDIEHYHVNAFNDITNMSDDDLCNWIGKCEDCCVCGGCIDFVDCKPSLFVSDGGSENSFDVVLFEDVCDKCLESKLSFSMK